MSIYNVIPEEYKLEYQKKFQYGTKDNPLKEEYCENDPTIFAYYKLGKKLRLYQDYAISKFLKSRYSIWCWGRRLGKSLAIAVIALWAASYNKIPTGIHQNTIILIVSQTYDASLKLIDDINNLIYAGDVWMSKVTKGKVAEFFTSRREGTNNREQVTIITNGKPCFIKAYPPTNRVKGNAASITILDEAAHLDCTDPRKFYDETFAPVITDNYNSKTLITSTPNGKSGLFYELFDPDELNEKNIFEKTWYGYEIHDDPDYQLQALQDKEQYLSQGKQREWEQEREALFTSSEGYFFDPFDVANCVEPKMTAYTTYEDECYVGIDFGGQTTSHTVVTISAKINNKIVRLFCRVYPVKGDYNLLEDLEFLQFSFPRIIKYIVDDCPAGWHIIQKMEDKGYPVTRMNFRAEKIKKFGQFRAKLHQEKIVTFRDEYLQKEMYGLNAECKANRGYTDDAIDSWVMSTYHLIEDQVQFRFYEVDFDAD